MRLHGRMVAVLQLPYPVSVSASEPGHYPSGEYGSQFPGQRGRIETYSVALPVNQNSGRNGTRIGGCWQCFRVSSFLLRSSSVLVTSELPRHMS